MAKIKSVLTPSVVGGVDTHKDLHVAAVVDENNRVLGSKFFGYAPWLSKKPRRGRNS